MSRAVVEAARALRRAIHDFDPETLSALDAAAVASELSQAEKACAAARTLAGARAAQCGAHKEMGFSDAASWLAHEAGTTSRQARDALALTIALEACPETKGALLAGEVSVSQAQEIVRCAAELAGAEKDLLDVARRGDLSDVREQVREKQLSSIPVGDLHRRQLAARRFRHWRDGMGMICFDGALPPETGIPFVSRLEREATHLRNDARRNRCEERFEVHAADAFVALSTGNGHGATIRSDLSIVCDLFAWRRGHAHEGEPCHLIGGGPIPVELAKELSKDAFFKIVLHDGKDVQRVQHVGRKCTAQLRTALDLGPVPAFNGRACVDCGRTWGLQNDHVDPVAHTGPTSLENVKARCWTCHAEKTAYDRKAGLLGRKAKSRPNSSNAAAPSGRDQLTDRSPPADGDPPAHDDPPIADHRGRQPIDRTSPRTSAHPPAATNQEVTRHRLHGV